MKTGRIIVYVLAVSVLFISLWSCAKKEDRPKEEYDSQSSTNDSQITKSGGAASQTSSPDIPAIAEKEVRNDNDERLQKQVDEVRKTFISLQDVCKANNIDGYLDFWDDETKMAVDGQGLNLDERRERRRKSLVKTPGILQEIANVKTESITVDISEAEKIQDLYGVEIKGTMMLVRTSGRAFLFHETAKGWKLWNTAPPGYYR
jgi:hypothetical protein